MARPRLSMRKFNEVLRLKHHCGLSKRQIAQSCQISRSTVADYLWRAEQAGVSWPLPQDLTDQELRGRLRVRPESGFYKSWISPVRVLDLAYRTNGSRAEY